MVFEALAQLTLIYVSAFMGAGYKACFKIASVFREVAGAVLQEWLPVSKVCACREGCWGSGVLNDKRSWAVSRPRWRRVLRPEVSLRLRLGPPR